MVKVASTCYYTDVFLSYHPLLLDKFENFYFIKYMLVTIELEEFC